MDENALEMRPRHVLGAMPRLVGLGWDAGIGWWEMGPKRDAGCHGKKCSCSRQGGRTKGCSTTHEAALPVTRALRQGLIWDRLRCWNLFVNLQGTRVREKTFFGGNSRSAQRKIFTGK